MVLTKITTKAVETYCIGGTLKYELPKSEVSLGHVFQVMASLKALRKNASGGIFQSSRSPERKDEQAYEKEEEQFMLNVLDWGVASATLEQVFIKLIQMNTPSLETVNHG